MNNTNSQCPANKLGNHIIITDHRPRKVLYTGVTDSNKFRQYLQNNATKLMELNSQTFDRQFGCPPELTQPKNTLNVRPYNE